MNASFVRLVLIVLVPFGTFKVFAFLSKSNHLTVVDAPIHSSKLKTMLEELEEHALSLFIFIHTRTRTHTYDTQHKSFTLMTLLSVRLRPPIPGGVDDPGGVEVSSTALA